MCTNDNVWANLKMQYILEYNKNIYNLPDVKKCYNVKIDEKNLNYFKKLSQEKEIYSADFDFIEKIIKSNISNLDDYKMYFTDKSYNKINGNLEDGSLIQFHHKNENVFVWISFYIYPKKLNIKFYNFEIWGCIWDGTFIHNVSVDPGWGIVDYPNVNNDLSISKFESSDGKEHPNDMVKYYWSSCDESICGENINTYNENVFEKFKEKFEEFNKLIRENYFNPNGYYRAVPWPDNDHYIKPRRGDVYPKYIVDKNKHNLMQNPHILYKVNYDEIRRCYK